MSKSVAVKKVPERKCLGCMQSFPKNSLVRIVRSSEGEVSLDMTGKKSGRGAYICKSSACLNKAVKAKRFQRAFECEVPEAVFDGIRKELEEAQ